MKVHGRWIGALLLLGAGSFVGLDALRDMLRGNARLNQAGAQPPQDRLDAFVERSTDGQDRQLRVLGKDRRVSICWDSRERGPRPRCGSGRQGKSSWHHTTESLCVVHSTASGSSDASS